MKGRNGYAVAHRFSFHGFSLRHVWEKVSGWYEVRRERELLASMSDEALKDMGLSRADVEHEVARPFWDDPMHK